LKKQITAEIEDLEEELDQFDPFAELLKINDQKDNSVNSANR
jgi:hypothetical protein